MNTVAQHKLVRFFSGEQLAIATKHGKEQVLEPLLSQILGVKSQTVPELDTDQFGTFSGERERLQGPLETARLKCFAASHLAGCRLALASEGSFGAHPVLGIIPANEELLLLTDLRYNIEFKVVHLSTRTNFAGRLVHSWEEACAFAEKAGFPAHGLMVRSNQESVTGIRKGITTWQQLQDAYLFFHDQFGAVFLETDMRALYNPTRMAVIGEAAQQLVTMLSRFCPSCDTPGFTLMTRQPGLPCQWCYRPTRGILADLYRCQRCGFTEEIPYPGQKQSEDPQFCDVCNP